MTGGLKPATDIALVIGIVLQLLPFHIHPYPRHILGKVQSNQDCDATDGHNRLIDLVVLMTLIHPPKLNR